MSFILTKFFENSKYQQDFIDGKLYFSSLSEFSDLKIIGSQEINGEKMGLLRNQEQRDPSEGIVADIKASEQNLETLFPNLENNFLLNSRIRALGYSYCNVMSFHKIVLTFSFEYGPMAISREETDMSNFGEFAIIVTKPNEFIQRVKKAIQKNNNWDYAIGSIAYHLPQKQEIKNNHLLLLSENTFTINNLEKKLNNKISLEYDAFDKFIMYQKQKEWRIFINRNIPNKDNIRYLDVGNLSDCVKKTTRRDLDKSINKLLYTRQVYPINDSFYSNLSREQMRQKVLDLGNNEVQILLTLIASNKSVSI